MALSCVFYSLVNENSMFEKICYKLQALVMLNYFRYVLCQAMIQMFELWYSIENFYQSTDIFAEINNCAGILLRLNWVKDREEDLNVLDFLKYFRPLAERICFMPLNIISEIILLLLILFRHFSFYVCHQERTYQKYPERTCTLIVYHSEVCVSYNLIYLDDEMLSMIRISVLIKRLQLSEDIVHLRIPIFARTS